MVFVKAVVEVAAATAIAAFAKTVLSVMVVVVVAQRLVQDEILVKDEQITKETPLATARSSPSVGPPVLSSAAPSPPNSPSYTIPCHK